MKFCKILGGMWVGVQPLSHVWLFATPWTAARLASLPSTVSQSLFKFMSIESVMLSLIIAFFSPFFSLRDKPENEMVGWHHWLNRHEFEQALGDGEGQRSLACCSPRGHKESIVSFMLAWRTPFNIPCKAGLLVINSLSFCLLGKVFILPIWIITLNDRVFLTGNLLIL